MTIGQQNNGSGADAADLPRGCRLVGLSARGDDRGNLVAIEAFAEVPFAIERAYYIYGTRPGVTRGHHAHRNLRQLLVAVTGSCTIAVTDGRASASVLLDEPTRGMMIEGLIWREMRDFSADCVLLVLADARYDEHEYIRDFETFRALAQDGP